MRSSRSEETTVSNNVIVKKTWLLGFPESVEKKIISLVLVLGFQFQPGVLGSSSFVYRTVSVCNVFTDLSSIDLKKSTTSKHSILFIYLKSTHSNLHRLKGVISWIIEKLQIVFEIIYVKTSFGRCFRCLRLNSCMSQTLGMADLPDRVRPCWKGEVARCVVMKRLCNSGPALGPAARLELLAVWSWTSYLTSLWLSFLSYRMVIIPLPISCLCVF